jgi:hypothetical protein
MKITNLKFVFTIIILAGGTVLATPSYSQSGQRGNGPPPEAFNACSGKTEQVSCSVQTPHGSLSGTCRKERRGQRLICVPSNGGPEGRHSGQRPQEENQRQNGGSGRAMREHTTTQSSGLNNLVPATDKLSIKSKYTSSIIGDWSVFQSNAIAEDNVGKFPN